MPRGLFNRKNSSKLAPGLPPEEEFEKPWVSQIQNSSEIPRSSAAGRFIDFLIHNGPVGLLAGGGALGVSFLMNKKSLESFDQGVDLKTIKETIPFPQLPTLIFYDTG